MTEAHLQAMFEHDINGIYQEEFTLESDVTLHLLVDSSQQLSRTLEVIASNQNQVVVHLLWFFHQVGNPTIIPKVGDPEAAWIWDSLHPGNSPCCFSRQEGKISID